MEEEEEEAREREEKVVTASWPMSGSVPLDLSSCSFCSKNANHAGFGCFTFDVLT